MRKRRALLLVANLILGALLLAWLLDRHGGTALEQLSPRLSWPLLGAFLAVVVLTVGAFTARWRMLLAGVGATAPWLPLLAWRAAGQGVAALVPSAKLGGDPLRAWLAARSRLPAPDAIASVAVDRGLEIGAAMPFSIVFATVLLQHGIPGLESALVTLVCATLALAAAGVWTGHRLARGRGIVSSFVRRTRLDTVGLVERRLDLVGASEAVAGRMVADRRRLALAFAVGLGANLLVLLEFALLLAAFGLPTAPVAVVAAVFATAAAHQLPVPAGIGVLEGAQMWLFQALGYPADVGLAVGLVARLRETVWALPGLVYLVARGLRPAADRARSAPPQVPADG